jgi:PhnB protein
MAAKAKKKAKSTAKKAAKKKASSKVTRKAKPAAKSARAVAKPVKARPKARPKAKARPVTAKAQPAAAPPRYHTVTPMLNIEGADEAISFFKDAFGASERVRMPGPDGKIMHAELLIGDSVVMISDVMQQPATKSSIFLYVPDCDAVYSQAVAAGANAAMPLQDMFWGDRFGSVTDPFGNTWSVATHKEDVSPEEMQRRMEALPPMGGPPAAA